MEDKRRMVKWTFQYFNDLKTLRLFVIVTIWSLFVLIFNGI